MAEENKHADKQTDEHIGPIMHFYLNISKYAKKHKVRKFALLTSQHSFDWLPGAQPVSAWLGWNVRKQLSWNKLKI